jgi:hypothetical protein
MLKDKISQTGWKLRENFLKKTNAFLDEKDRIDVFSGSAGPVEQEESDGSDDDVIILEY